jgi:PncC family amidohydrolase
MDIFLSFLKRISEAVMNTEYNDAKTVNELTKRLANTLIDSDLTLTTAESCTGGKLAAALCAQADTAEFYDIGVITFSDRAKQKMLGVRASTLEKYSAVSEQTVSEMSVGIREQAETDISIAISGYAGPEGGEDGTPAGTVWFAWNFRGQIITKREYFSGDCQDVIEKAVRFSLAVLVEEVSVWKNK